MPIRPITTPGPFRPLRVMVFRTGEVACNNTTTTLTIRPPDGHMWEVLDAFGLISQIVGQNATTTTKIRIQYSSDSNIKTQITGVSYQSGDVFSNQRYEARTNGQILTNEFFMTIQAQNTSPHDNIVDLSCVVRRV